MARKRPPADGNVHASKDSGVGEVFKEGDVVELTPSAIRTWSVKDMTPKELYKLGHENRFLVLGSFTDEENGPCVTLFPCCHRFVDRKDDHHPFRCTGHPSVYFKKVDVRRMPQKGDKSAALKLPFLPWDVAAVDWEEDSDNPKLSLSIMGQKGSISGPWAKFLKNLAETEKLF